METNKNRGKEKRKFIRVKFSIPLRIETPDITYSSCEGNLKNVSADGAMVELPRRLTTGLLVKINFSLDKEEASLVGYVKWQRKHKDNYRIGIKFDHSCAEQNDRTVTAITQKIINKNKNR